MGFRDVPSDEGMARFQQMIATLQTKVTNLQTRPGIDGVLASIAALQAPKPATRINRSVDWTMPSGTLTQLFMESTVFTQSGMQNLGGGAVPSFVKVPVPGVYLAVNQISWAVNSGGDRAAYIATDAGGFVAEHISQANTVGDSHIMQVTAIVKMAAGEGIAPWGFHRAAGGLVVEHVNSHFSVALLSS